ncbi:1-acyl-sn-glycerol-3-phosphate acyltransferase [Myxococcus fulvus]|uniref:1-acyl-sn-glycerol-3-phosphate acyltransferase n=1 Tax=Myxococcus fulvus TaxID=33 RepID=UPI003B9C60EC
MAKGVLGNDPFQRGAASREGERTKPGTPPRDRSPSEREGTVTQKAHTKNGADAKKQPAPGKTKSRGPEARGSERNGRDPRKDAKRSAPSSTRDADNRNSKAARGASDGAKHASARHDAARNDKGAQGASGGAKHASARHDAPRNDKGAPGASDGAKHASARHDAPRNDKGAQGASGGAKHASARHDAPRNDKGAPGASDGAKHASARHDAARNDKGAQGASGGAKPFSARHDSTARNNKDVKGASSGENRPATTKSDSVPRDNKAARGGPTGAKQPPTSVQTSPAKPSPSVARSRPSEAPRDTGASDTSPLAATENEVEPLREPAAPVTPRSPPPSRAPVLEDRTGERTPQQRDVDHALAEALAAEVAEVTAKHAVDEAMDRRAGREESTDRLLATEMATGLAEAAVEEVLDHSPVTRKPEHERELAATVAAQVAESAAELAVAEVMVHRSAGPPFTEAFEERATVGFLDELDEAEEVSELELREDLAMAGAVLELEDLDETPEEVEDGWERTISRPVVDSSFQAPEVEMPDTTRDEFPPGRRGPLSLVPPSRGDAAPHGDSSEPARDTDSARPLAQRASGMLALAREIAGQALASEGLGRAWGAMNGMLDAVRAGLGTGGGSHLDEYGKDPSLVERLEPVLEFLYGQYWRVSAQGTDHIPAGAVILVANHSGALPYDGLVMSLTLGRERPDLRESRWLVEDQVFHAPMLGTLFNRLGAVRACPENALRLLDEQRPLVVFPEGYQGLSKPFGERYRLKRFGRGGFVKLALRTGAPIVPVAIVGAEETSPMLGRIPASFLGLPYLPLMPGPLPLPAKWSIRFGEPIAMDGLPPEAADDLGEVGRLTERTREAIQGMLHSLLRERRSVFAG